MNYSLKSRTVIAQMLPGVFLIAALGLIWVMAPTLTIPTKLTTLLSTATTSTAVGAGLIALLFFLALVAGLLLDTVRELLERHWDSLGDKDSAWWDFFFTGDADKVGQLDEYYYSYYQLDANFTLVSIILFFDLLYVDGLNWFLLCPIVVGVICFLDGRKLRKDLKRLVQEYRRGENEEFPHYKVNTRLRCSKLSNGVGVFAIGEIKKGAPIFFGDNGEPVWISRQKLKSAALSDEAKQLYRDFAIFKDDKCGCPTNFDNLTVAWYLNEPNGSDAPNVKCKIDEGYKFYASQDIAKGEELTARYSEYSLKPWSELER